MSGLNNESIDSEDLPLAQVVERARRKRELSEEQSRVPVVLVDDSLKKQKKKAVVVKQPKKPWLKLRAPITAESYVYEPYVTDAAGLKAKLAEYGVAIIPNVLDAQQCKEMVDGVWDYLTKLTSGWETPITRDNAESWEGLFDLFPMHGMLLQHFGVGHSQFMWNLRQNPSIVAIFATLWGVKPEDLLVSFDGASIHMPPETTKKGKYRKTWFHTDQRFTNSKFQCVQSWVTGLDVNAGDATLTVLPKSHLFHHGFAVKFGKTDFDENWFKLEDQPQIDFFFDKGCTPISIKCPSGSMVFWDSRTMHCGQESMPWRQNTNFRMIGYLCYVPRSRAEQKELKKKRKMFDNLQMSTHWPHKPRCFKGIRLYPGAQKPQVTPIEPPVLSALGKRLAGF